MSSSIWTAGSADGFRIGRERTDNDPHPINTPKNAFIKTISASWRNGYFATSKNEFYSWGVGQSYRLATGNRIDSPTPQLVNTFPPDFDFQLIVSGDKFGAALSTSGEVMVWGAGYAHSPTKLDLETTVVHIAAGQQKLMCALSDGRVAIANRHSPIEYVTVPNATIVKVALGTSHFLALSDDGIAYSWGGNSPATGQPDETLEPTQIPNLPHSIQSIFAYHNNSWFVDIDGCLYYCGANIDGSLGIGSTAAVRAVQQHTFKFGDEPVVQVACGDDFTLVLNSAGQIFGAGNPIDGRTMVPNTQMSTEFQECVKMKGQMVTQISCGCYSAAMLVNGAPPPDVGDVLLKDFREFRIPKNPVSIGGPKGKRITLEPGEEILFKNGLQQGDVLADRRLTGENKCMVIGVYEDKPYVITESDCTIIPLNANSFTEIITQYELIERPGSQLFQAPGINGENSIAVDNSEEPMLIFNGLKVGDCIDSSSVIAGARGSHLFALKDGLLGEVDFHSIKTVIRNGISIDRYSMADGNLCFIQAAKEKGRIYFNSNYGACEFVGTLSDIGCFSSPADFGSLRTIECSKLSRVEKGNEQIEVFLNPQQKINVNISIENTIKSGFIPLDLVQTNNDGIGFVFGTYQDKVAIRLEQHRNNYGFISLYDPESLTLLGRVNYKGERNIPELSLSVSVNTQDFNDLKVLPGDVLELEDGEFVVIIGYKDGICYMKNIKSNKIEHFTTYKKLIKRTIPTFGECCYNDKINVNVSTFMLGLTKHIPGEIFRANGKEYRFLGISADSQSLDLFIDVETKEISSLDPFIIDLPL